MADSLALEIHVHMTDGSVQKFSQRDPEEAAGIVASVVPHRFFAQAQLVIAGTTSLTAFQPAWIERVDLVTDLQLDWAYPNGVREVREITAEEYSARYRPDSAEFQATQSGRVGDKMVKYIVAESVSGRKSFFELVGRVLPPLEQRHIPAGLFASASMHARRSDRGVILLNTANMVRFSMYPGLTGVPQNAWSASRLERTD